MKSAFNRSVPMSDSKSSDSPQVKFIDEWLQAFDARDMDRIAKCLHKDYRNIMYPRSLGKPEETKEEWLEYMAGIFNLWTERKVRCLNRYWVPLCRG